MTFEHNKKLDLTRKSTKKVNVYFLSITAETKPPPSTGKHARGNFTVNFFRHPCPFSNHLSFVNVLLYQQILTVFLCVLCWFCVKGIYIKPFSFKASKIGEKYCI